MSIMMINNVNCILSWINPIIARIYGYTGFLIEKLETLNEESE